MYLEISKQNDSLEMYFYKNFMLEQKHKNQLYYIFKNFKYYVK